MARLARMTAVLASAVGLLACGSSGDGSSSASTAGSTTAPSAAPSASAGAVSGAVVPAALEFDAPTVGGGQFDARTYAGQPLALWFWAPY